MRIPLPDIYVARADDWDALYVDGERVWEGHSLRWQDVLDALGVDYASDHFTDDYPELINGAGFPEDAFDLKMEYRE